MGCKLIGYYLRRFDSVRSQFRFSEIFVISSPPPPFLLFFFFFILLLSMYFLKSLLPLLAIIAGIFVITTKNAIISVFNLIVLYILVAFYLIFIGVNYLGLSYIIIYIGAIAILFLFIIIMIDVEVVEKKSNNYLPLLFFLLGGFLFAFKKILFNLVLFKL